MTSRLGSVAMLALVAVAGCKPDVAPKEVDPKSLTIRAVVADGELKNRKIWFDLSQSDIRFVLKADESSTADTIFAALKDSSKTGTTIEVAFSLDDAFIERESRRPTFAVVALTYRDKELAGVRPYRSLRADQLTEREDCLARGVALYHARLYADARRKLDRCIESRGLAYDLKALAYKARGYAFMDEVVSAVPDDAVDKQLLKALADFNVWARIQPDNSSAARAIAESYAMLGAYDRALTDYARIAERWPEQKYRAAVRIGAIQRQLGDYARALRALDDLVATDGPQTGMMFHYHRGLTLTELKRYQEAAAEFTAGLHDQPDYGWALVRRACAHAQLGRVQAALDDQLGAVKLLEQSSPTMLSDRIVQANIDRAKVVVDELRSIVDSQPTKPTSIPCVGYPKFPSEQRRTRSKWLPKEASD